VPPLVHEDVVLAGQRLGAERAGIQLVAALLTWWLGIEEEVEQLALGRIHGAERWSCSRAARSAAPRVGSGGGGEEEEDPMSTLGRQVGARLSVGVGDSRPTAALRGGRWQWLGAVTLTVAEPHEGGSRECGDGG
jgi:hypothetical protein